jgi:hypothetical protein
LTWGQGHGTAFGGEPLEEVADPRSEVGEDPITFDMTDEPNGPLPGAWDRYEYTVSGGLIAGSAEADPDAYYRVVDGRGLWAYIRTPATGQPYSERGVAASPRGVLQGRNGRVAVLLDSVLPMLDAKQDELWYEVIAGLRTDDGGTSYVGGRVFARWLGGAWDTPLLIEAVRADGAPPAVLATATLPDLSGLALWRVSLTHELSVEVRDGTLRVEFDGTIVIEVDVAETGPARPIILARVYRRLGLLLTPVPVVVSVQCQTLRDIDKLGVPLAALGPTEQFEAPLHGQIVLPLAELLALGHVKRVGGRLWEFTQDVETDVGGVEYLWKTGDVVRATEPYSGQVFTSVAPDLARVRAKRGV